jgi:integrase
VIYRRAVRRGDVAVNPTSGLQLPAARGRRERVASPAEAAELIAALLPRDRALWASAMYAGLRRGELLALRWEDVDLGKGVIRVERSYDPKDGVFVTPKTRAGRRAVPIASLLRAHLLEHRLASGRSEGLVFGATAIRPFTPSNATRRASTAWAKANTTRRDRGLTPLEPISLHECRHTFASLMIASGVNAKALATYMGHASVTITYDRYGHLMPGNEGEAAALLDAYLERGLRQTDVRPSWGLTNAADVQPR